MADYGGRPGIGAVFYPSPRFQTDSPVRAGQETGSPHQKYSYNGYSSTGVPPANLHSLDPSAFNVDPGVPFLATAGPSNAGSDTSKESLRAPRNKMSSIAGGLKNAVKKSLRRDHRTGSQLENGRVYGSDDFRDSGYASSSRLPQFPPTPALLPPAPHHHHHRRPKSSYQTPGRPLSHPLHAEQRFSVDSPQSQISETLLGHDGYLDENKYRRHQQKHREEEETLIGHEQLYVPEHIGSPVLVEPEFGENYLRMPPPTPPSSDPSIHTYISRFKHLIEEITALPWVSNERCTIDYFPGTMSHRAHHLQHRPAIAWHSQDFNRNNYHLFFDADENYSDSSSFISGHHPSMMQYATPYPGNPADLNLMQEFDDDDDQVHRDVNSGMAAATSFQVPSQNPILAPGVDLSQGISGDWPPRFPNGYVPYAQQHVGLQYGVPIHAIPPSNANPVGLPAAQTVLPPRIVYLTPSPQNSRIATG